MNKEYICSPDKNHKFPKPFHEKSEVYDALPAIVSLNVPSDALQACNSEFKSRQPHHTRTKITNDTPPFSSFFMSSKRTR
jgi:hypothetical protein